MVLKSAVEKVLMYLKIFLCYKAGKKKTKIRQKRAQKEKEKKELYEKTKKCSDLIRIERLGILTGGKV